MPQIQRQEWLEFSKNHLPDVKNSRFIERKQMTKAMGIYLESKPDLELSPTAKKTLKRYAFHKADQDYKNTAVLTHAVANQIFHHFDEALSNLQAELNSDSEFVKSPKPQVPKGLARLSIFSASVVEKYLDPKYKANIQDLFHQIHKINQVVKPLFETDSNLNPNKILTLELISKHIAYYNPQNGEKFLIPHEGRMVEYQAEEIHLWMGTFAYGFKPVDKNETAPPILAFSGTRLSPSSRGSLATVTADFDPRGVGYIAYSNGKKDITNWLNKANGKALITGHSLGAAISHYTAIDHPELVQGAYTFSAPGISTQYGKKWKQLENDPIKKVHIYNFNHMDDKVPTFGQSYVGTNYQMILEKMPDKKNQRGIHKKQVFGRKVALLCKTHPKKSLKVWQQRAISIIPFIVCMALLFLGRLLFGIHTSKPYVSLFGPLRWSWRKLITEKLAAKYFQPNAAAA